MRHLTLTLAVLTLMIPTISMGTPYQGPELKPLIHNAPISNQFSTAGTPSIIEWGCPVSEVVKAPTGAEAIQQIGEECMAEAKQAAIEKPEVFDVIKVSIIVPDVIVSEAKKGYFLTGTFFVETIVLEGMGR